MGGLVYWCTTVGRSDRRRGRWRTAMADYLKGVPEDWQSRMTITVDEYAQIVGIGRNTAYEAVRAGEVAVMRQRGRILVCVPPLLPSWASRTGRLRPLPHRKSASGARSGW